MRVAYFVQTHSRPLQILRLVAALRSASPGAVLVVGHDPSGEPFDPAPLRRLDALFFRPRRAARRGHWSLLEPYFEAVELLARSGVAYDWLVYLSGQDYPVRPVADSEAALAASPWDGYLSWRPVEGPSEEGRRRQGRLRYGYRYSPYPLWALPRLVRLANGLQPWWHLHLTYGPRLGWRARQTPFGPELRAYWGSQWTTLRRACAERVAEAGREGSPLAAWFARTICPDEAFAQTVLLGDARFRLSNDSLRFVDVRGSRDGRPRVLRREDLPLLTCGRYAFARKFDADVDAAVLDELDERVLVGR